VMHQKMAHVTELCVQDIRAIQKKARSAGAGVTPERPRWPMIILRTPKGWTGPKKLDGHKVEGSWRAHQIPILDPVSNPAHLEQVESWLLSYRPEELFDENGTLIAELKEMAPQGTGRISGNPHANGGALRKPLDLPDFRDYAVAVKQSGQIEVSSIDTLAHFLRDVMRKNMKTFRVWTGRDRLEQASGDLRSE
jgi:xylulose-5-phosphate/fructose-6-phosphate phosphoketolase